MCEMKTGRCRECIHDCNKSLNFTPTVKAFLRRAAAFETIEKYAFESKNLFNNQNTFCKVLFSEAPVF